MDNYLSRLGKRHTTARTVLDTLATVFLGCSVAFWLVLHFTALYTPAPYIPQAIVSVVMTLVYAFALPLLLSMLVPTTPAGQALQRTQWRTIGFPVIIASALFLGWWARMLIYSWFMAQPAIHEAGLEMAYSIACLIGFVVIPALCWVQVTPERWMREIQNAHAVRKMEVMQQSELAIIRATLLKAEQRAIVGYANLIPQERDEVFATMRALLLGMNDQQKAIARGLGISADLEREMLGDRDIADQLDYVKQALERSEIKMIEMPAHADTTATVNSREMAPATKEPQHVNTRLQSSISRETSDDTRRQVTTGDDAYARAARDHFGRRPWTVKQLATCLDIGETKAREMRDDWQAAGLIDEANLGRWYFV